MINKCNERLDGIEVVCLIKAKMVKGDGTANNPIVGVSRFFDFNGNMIAECVNDNTENINVPSNYQQFLQLLQLDAQKQ